jgi:hypothetical protein
VSLGVAAPLSPAGATLATQYEWLRSAALGDPLPPTARHGLVVFLRRGMWAWARAVAVAPSSSTRRPRPTPSPDPASIHGVVQLFATMALSSADRRP